ncbi:hypothetical protein SEPCBS57363_005081 [Sporothrix epigloea]|uniref:Fumarylacetoacetase-like C-terminal domain-containing protein n=1 Tax=Sporothrix epigloea TaxID=1892477 RepID=A0ABP0DVM8_9PEZI
MPSFTRLIRFLAQDGRIHYGDALLPSGISDMAQATQARVIRGSIFGTHTVTDEIADVRMLLAPLAPEDVRTVRCLGINYALHAKETKLPVPKYPVLFYKPVTSLTGPRDNIPVAPIAQEGQGLDYECELVVVIGKACKDVSEEDALSVVLGYAVGNDVSHREWQMQRGGGQWSLGKGFDGWAPWGPGIVAASQINPLNLAIRTTLNGRQVQSSTTADMIFNVRQAISFLSRGTTLQPGDLIFTGTPSGVGMGRTPKLWLQDGDVVEVSLEGVGSCVNRVTFERERPKL